MKTKAFVLLKKGSPEKAFVLQDVELPALNEHEIIVEGEAFGVNYADVMARNGLYRETPPLPCVIGYEIVGKITEVGHPRNSHLIGKRVVGFTRFGGYAQHAITTEKAIVEIGDMPANDALALATQGVTAYYMANYIAPIRKNERVLIHAAAGGVGTLLIQLAKQAGATVYAKVSSTEKAKKCIELGADYAIDYSTSDYADQIKNILGKHSIDVAYNPIGGRTFKSDKSLMGFGSKHFLFGGSELAEGKLGMISQLNFLRKMGILIPAFMMMQSKSIIGVNMLKIADQKPDILHHCLEAIVALYQKGTIKTENGGDFSFTDLNRAHTLLESGKSIGKIAIHW